MVQGFSQAFVHSSDHLDIDFQIPTQSVSRLKQVEPFQDGDLPTQPTETFALTTELAFHVAPAPMQDLEGPTINTLATPQKVGRSTKTPFFAVTMRLF